MGCTVTIDGLRFKLNMQANMCKVTLRLACAALHLFDMVKDGDAKPILCVTC